jgi:hypothetical protein
MTPNRILLAAAAAILLLASESSRSSPMADWFRENMIDAQDGMIDMSDYLSGASGFFPVPIIITEPAVGVGIGAAVAYFHPPNDIDASVHPHSGPPSISVGFAAVTDNDTKLGGGAHLGSWRDDHVRYLGALAAADVNLKFFPNLGEPGTEEEGIRFNVDGTFLYQQLQFRLQESNWWLGGSFLFIDAKNSFDDGNDAGDALPGPDADFQQGGLGIFVEYDGRNTVFTPSKGLKGLVEYRNYDKRWGSDFNYDHIVGSVQHFTPFGDYSSLGVRLEAETVSGDVPFFGFPYVNLRGMPALRYQGEDVVTLELEYLWGITPRWSLALFAGAGRATSVDVFGTDDETVAAGGAGVRYRIARKLGLQVGLDVARGPEETAYYLTVGSAWQ